MKIQTSIKSKLNGILLGAALAALGAVAGTGAVGLDQAYVAQPVIQMLIGSVNGPGLAFRRRRVDGFEFAVRRGTTGGEHGVNVIPVPFGVFQAAHEVAGDFYDAFTFGQDGKLGLVDANLINADNPFGMNPDDPAGQDDILINSNIVHLPINQPVTALLRSQDVLHDFAVPQFRVKMDLVPGLDQVA